MSLSDCDFINQFEQLTLPEEHFNHRGHLRLAWLYLRRYSLDAAIENLSDGIQAYASSKGATTKFHRTLTEAMARIMYERLQQSDHNAFEDFLSVNPDLLEDAQALIYSHYSARLLATESARTVFVEPDVRAFYV